MIVWKMPSISLVFKELSKGHLILNFERTEIHLEVVAKKDKKYLYADDDDLKMQISYHFEFEVLQVCLRIENCLM